MCALLYQLLQARCCRWGRSGSLWLVWLIIQLIGSFGAVLVKHAGMCISNLCSFQTEDGTAEALYVSCDLISGDLGYVMKFGSNDWQIKKSTILTGNQPEWNRYCLCWIWAINCPCCYFWCTKLSFVYVHKCVLLFKTIKCHLVKMKGDSVCVCVSLWFLCSNSTRAL